MIHFFYTRFNTQIPNEVWNSFYKHLPLEAIQRTKNYRRWEDQHAFVLGRLLLMECFNKIGISRNAIFDLKYNEFGKPFLNDDVDFSISHSGNFVVCAIGQKIKLGIDIEKITDIDIRDYQDIMTKEGWCQINIQENPLKSFFRFWTMKESIIKAEEKGLSIPLKEINILSNKVVYNNKSWYLIELILNENICTTLASNIANPNLDFYEVDFYQGLKEIKTVQDKIQKIALSFYH